jgi:soluble lytic murein transglycosylase-like protein
MNRVLPSRIGLAAALLCVAAAPAAHGLERVTLRNGFSYDCARQEAIDATHVRLYLTADAANFIDLSAQSIAAIEPLPDPPAPVPQPAPVPTPAAASASDIPTLLAHAGHAHNIDVDLLASVIKTESDGQPLAVSRTGARGLMQLMPSTAASLGVTDAFQPSQNISGGTAYLDALLTRYHDNLALALAAYNAGPAAVDRYHGIPPFRETRAYVLRVMNDFKRRKAADEIATKTSSQAIAKSAAKSPATSQPHGASALALVTAY